MAGNPQCRTFVDPGGHGHLEIVVLVDFATPAAGFARLVDKCSLAVAYRANGYLLKTDRSLVLGFLPRRDLLAAAAAMAARARFSVFLGSGALAILA